MCVVTHRHLPADERGPSAARAFVETALAEALEPSTSAITSDVALVANELVTDSISEGATILYIETIAHRGLIELTVIDDRPRRRRSTGARSRRSGFAGSIVAGLALDRRVVAREDGSTVTYVQLSSDAELKDGAPCRRR